MIEKIYQFNKSEDRMIEKLLDNDEVMINHVILNQEDNIPQHDSNSNVYLIIVKGNISLVLEDQSQAHYSEGNIVNIPYGTKMDISNTHKEQLEFFIIKAPSPKAYK